ncbi:MAG: hypothetical protein C4537_04120 [Acholeplasma sp.]|jgi:carboxyl-terminal processing protease|nr:MAG: hypothetical protein C4537_04120 [Acholeplasma sp.]
MVISRKIGILVLIGFVLSFFAGYYIESILPTEPKTNTDTFQYIVDAFQNYYYYDIDDEDVHEAFIATMQATVDTLAERNDDPYTRLVATPLSADPTDDEKFIGVGMSLSAEEGQLRIVSVYPNGAAAGILYPNDVILGFVENGIHQYFSADDSAEKMFEKLSGELGEVKEFIISNPDKEEVIVPITYQEVLTPTVYQKSVNDPNIAYIRISRFAGPSETSQGTASIFQSILNELESTKLTGEQSTLILDLRDNPGGSLTALHNRGSQGISPGITQQLLVRNLNQPLFSMIPKSGVVENFYGNLNTPKPYDIKVLVNESSASAAEVLAAALSVEGGYTLYGMPTYGKGVYQNTIVLQDIRGVRYSLIYTEGEWFYGDGLQNVSTEPLEVTPLFDSGIKSLELPIYDGVMSVDHVYEELGAYQAFFNYYYQLEGVHALRTDGYFDEATRLIVAQFNIEFEIIGDALGLLSARKVHDLFQIYDQDITFDNEVNEIISLINTL